MKKTKLMMPILGIAAIGSTIAPLTALTSCNKQEYKVELYNDTTLENKLYANSKTINLFFKQNNINNVTKTRVKMVNLKIDGAEAATVDGLTKMVVDAAGGIRVTINLVTMFKHYSNPNTIEFGLLFYNKANAQKYTVEGIKFNIDQDKEVKHPFKTEGTVIKGFIDDVADFKPIAFAQAYPEIFVEVDIPATTVVTADVIGIAKNPFENDPSIPTYDLVDVTPLENVSKTVYKMVIPAKYTSIDPMAFAGTNVAEKKSWTTIPYGIIALDFAPNSKMESIGATAFALAPFGFVNLPASIKTIGEGCFMSAPYLVSMQFAPKLNHNNGLEIPGGFIANTPIVYLKLPTYISKISPYSPQSGATVPAINSASLTLDLSEWTSDDFKKLTYTPLAIKNNFMCFACSPMAIKAAQKIFVDDKEASIIAKSDIIYSYTKNDTGVTVELNNSSTLSSFITYITDTNKKALKIDFPFWKWEMPNFGAIKEAKYNVTELGASLTNYIAGAKGYMSSVALPCNLEEIKNEQFVKSQYFWEVYIPASVTELTNGVFAITELSSIKYGGTKEQWEKITFAKTTAEGPAWNYECPEITVTCADGNIITIPTTRKTIEITGNK